MMELNKKGVRLAQETTDDKNYAKEKRYAILIEVQAI